MSAPDRLRSTAPSTSLPSPDALDETSALFVLTLADDGRAVPPALRAAAEAFAARHPRVAGTRSDLRAIGEVLSSEPSSAASGAFTARVLAAHGRSERRAASVLPMAGRLAAAAALLLVLGLAWQLGAPESAVADPRVERQRHLVDELWPDPFGPQRVEQGLLRLLPGPSVLGAPGAQGDEDGAR